MTIKIGQCYIAKFTKQEMPVRIESQKDNGIWISRSLTHGRVVFVKNEQILRVCNESDLVEYAKTVVPNRRSKKQTPSSVLAAETPHVARVRKAKAKRPSVPEFGLTLVEAAYRILREAKRPLSCQEIVSRAIQRKYWRSSGATPQNSLNATINRDMKANKEKSRFVKIGRGLFMAR